MCRLVVVLVQKWEGGELWDGLRLVLVLRSVFEYGLEVGGEKGITNVGQRL